MKLQFKNYGDKYRAGIFYRIATIEKAPGPGGWIYLVENKGKTLGGGMKPTLAEAKMCAEETFFGGQR